MNKSSTKRHPTKYPGVFYRLMTSRDGKGLVHVYYARWKNKDGIDQEEKVGRADAPDLITPAKTNHYRSGLRAETIKSRAQKKEERLAEAAKTTCNIDKLYHAYRTKSVILDEDKLAGQDRTDISFAADKSRYKIYLKDTFGDMEPQDISEQEIIDFSKALKAMPSRKKPGRNLEAATRKNILEVLRRIINYGAKKKLSSSLPFVIEMPDVDNETTEDLTDKELQNLMRVLGEYPDRHPASMMLLALYTGMRNDEIFSLNQRDLNWHRSLIVIHDPKSGERETVPMNDGAQRVFREIIALNPSRESLFVLENGKKFSTQKREMSEELNVIKKMAGLPADFRPMHGLRHVFACMLVSSGKVDLYTLQRLLRHRSPKMTQRYAKLRDETLKRASSVQDELISEATDSLYTDLSKKLDDIAISDSQMIEVV